MYVKLPAEDAKEGYCGRLLKAMYGTRDAASCWEETYRTHLEDNGFVCGASSPCVFYNADKNIRLVVHGDDFTFLCEGHRVEWVKSLMTKQYEIKIRGVLGDEKKDDKSIRILNRLLEWRKSGLAYKPIHDMWRSYSVTSI